MFRYFICVFFCSQVLFSIEPSQSFQKLVEGNERFQKSKSKQSEIKGKQIPKTQTPFSVIVACADSRVAPEILFDQGIGELFVVRVAGNVIGPLEMESIEYAVKHLGASSVLIMGHERCGAVDAVVKGQVEDIRYIAQLIKSSVVQAKASSPNDVLEAAIKKNAETMVKFVKQSSIVSDAIEKKQLDIRAAYFHFDTGAVEFLK